MLCNYRVKHFLLNTHFKQEISLTSRSYCVLMGSPNSDSDSCSVDATQDLRYLKPSTMLSFSYHLLCFNYFITLTDNRHNLLVKIDLEVNLGPKANLTDKQ